jgi:hypothetical protein
MPVLSAGEIEFNKCRKWLLASSKTAVFLPKNPEKIAAGQRTLAVEAAVAFGDGILFSSSNLVPALQRIGLASARCKLH